MIAVEDQSTSAESSRKGHKDSNNQRGVIYLVLLLILPIIKFLKHFSNK